MSIHTIPETTSKSSSVAKSDPQDAQIIGIISDRQFESDTEYDQEARLQRTIDETVLKVILTRSLDSIFKQNMRLLGAMNDFISL